ncbi:MAG: hypothetical protein MUF06_09900 [Pirellulaceae bacterium]|nr:hypothetical protein [Pirellulaceae bacterium]
MVSGGQSEEQTEGRARSWLACRLVLFLVGALVTLSPPIDHQLLAQGPGALKVTGVRVGVGGQTKAGFWAPIWLDLQGGPEGASGRLEIEIPDGDNVPAIFPGPAGDMLELRPGETKSFLRYAKIGRVSAPITVQLRGADGTTWSQELADLPARLKATQELIVGIGPKIDLAAAVATIKRPAEYAPVALEIAEPSELPDHWLGYESVDTLVVAAGDGKFLLAMSPKQRDALLEWIRLGGRMILAAGRSGDVLFAEDSPWRALAPGRLQEVSPLRERTGLETFTGSALPWETESLQRDRPLVTRLTELMGPVVVDEVGTGNNRPLVVRAAYGFGEIVFVGIDLEHPGLAAWQGRTRMMANLLAGSMGRAEPDEGTPRRGAGQLGYSDLVGQLRAALDRFPGVTLVSFTTIASLTIAYLLLIGPGDYLLLHWLNLPRQITWGTFALVTIVFGAGAWYLSRDARGDQMRTSGLEIVDLDAATGTARGTSWLQVYSPETVALSASAQIAAEKRRVAPPEVALAWQGVPGEALGGLSSDQRVLVSIDPYIIETPGRSPALVGLPVQSGSSKGISIRWWSQIQGPIASSLRRSEHGPVEGDITNPLPVEMTDSLLAYDGWLYRLGTIRPGEKIKIDSRQSLNLEYRLTERTVRSSKDIATPWDPTSTNVPRIAQMLMFHQAAGGRRYTGLSHRYQASLDLSESLKLGRAVLAGKVTEPAAELVTGDQPLALAENQTSSAWCRIVYPVEAYEPRERTRD